MKKERVKEKGKEKKMGGNCGGAPLSSNESLGFLGMDGENEG